MDDQNLPLGTEGPAIPETEGLGMRVADTSTGVDVDANGNATTIFRDVTHLAVSSGGVLNVAGRDVNHHQTTVYQEHQQTDLYIQQYDLPPLKDLQDRKRKERSWTVEIPISHAVAAVIFLCIMSIVHNRLWEYALRVGL